MHLASERAAAALLAAMLLLVTGTGAHAQSDAELRRENEQLRERLLALEQELEALKARIAALEGAPTRDPGAAPDPVPEAPGTPAGQDPGPSTPPISKDPAHQIEDATVIPSIAASPDEIIAYERLRYVARFGTNPYNVTDEPAQLKRVLREIDAWSISEAKAWQRTTVQWRLRVDRATRARDGQWSVMASEPLSDGDRQARDARGETVIPITFTLNRRIGDRLRDTLEAGGEVIVEGKVRLNVRLDPDRPAAGIFRQNLRPYIGPFCDAVVGLEVDVIEPAPA
ncbi:MAG: hypothetical protein O2819_02570 [Planctomycetota bacterium]|nr:hypothetical protein [Planctomycetota bacterium]